MAPTKVEKARLEPLPKSELSLDDMLRISRQKKTNEHIAQHIFGRDRRSSAPGALGKRSKTTDGLPTLASRIGGVQKRNTKSSVNLKRDAFQKTRALPMRPSQLQHSVSSGSGLTSRAGGAAVAPPQAPTAPKQNFSIRGVAGPVTVMATNFAPGTTAADIRSAFEPVGGEMLSCRLRSTSPSVVAEMIFTDKAGADAVVETFNDQKADGRLLHVYLHTVGASVVPTAPRSGRSWQHEAAAAKLESNGRGAASWTEEPGNSRGSGYRAEPEYQDGRYGFNGDREGDMDVELDQPSVDTNGSGRYESSRGRDTRDGGYRSNYHNGPGSGSGSGSGSYRDERRGGGGGSDDRYERSGRQERGLYSDRYARGGSSGGRNWRSTTLYL